MKKTILLFAMLFSAITLKAETVAEEPLDTDSNGYRNISTLAHLRWISETHTCWADRFELDNDINAADTRNWNKGKGFSPIGEGETNGFSGIIDGNGFEIDSLYMNRPNQIGVGLFGYFNGTIRNLGLVNCEIKGLGWTGGFVGIATNAMENSSLKDSYVIGSIEGGGYVGGLVGLQTNAEIINCFSDVTITAEFKVGGLVGSGGNIKFLNCHSTGNIIANGLTGGLIGDGHTLKFVRCYSNTNIIGNATHSDLLGGLIGACGNGYISECYATGNIKGNNLSRAGGLIGIYNNSSISVFEHTPKIINSYARGNVSGKTNLGGLIGILKSDKDTVSILNCYSTGRVNSSSVSSSKGSGGLIGDVELLDNAKLENIILNCFWDIETSNYDSSAGGTGRITNLMKIRSTYTDSLWDFKNIWSISSLVNDGYPNLSHQNQEIPTLISPKNSTSIDTLKPVFIWSKVINANSYILEISKTNLFDSTIIQEETNDTTYLITLDLANNETYYWRVKPKTDDSTNLWSDIWFFNTILDPVTLLLPANNSKDLPFNLLFEWEEHNKSQIYQFQLATSDTFGISILKDTIIKNLQNCELNNLAEYTNYFWRVRVKAGVQRVGLWSDIWEFSTDISPVILTTPQNNTKDISLTPVLEWEKHSISQKYQFQFATTDTFGISILKDTIIENTLNCKINNLTQFTNYFWRLRIKDSNEIIGLWSETWKFTTKINTVILTSPENNTKNIPIDTLLEWEQHSDFNNYQLQIDTSNTFENTIKDTKIENTLEYNITDLEYYTEYFWRVRINEDDEKIGLWSEIWKFRTEMNNVILVFPDSTKVGLPQNFNFKWKYIKGAEYYQLQVSKNIHFTDLVFSKDSLALHNPIDGEVGYPITDLEYNTKYFWRVRAWSVETYDLSEWSVIWYFTTGANSITDNLGLEIKIVPNPISKGQILTILNIPIELRKYAIKIYDINGNLIAFTNNDQIEISNGYSSGAYLLVLESNGDVIARKKFIVK